MKTIRTALLIILLVGVLALIITTWGSLGSVILTLALLLALAIIVIQKIMEKRDENDFTWEM